MVGDEAYSTPGFRKMIHDGVSREKMSRYRREKGELDGIDG